MVLFQKKGTGIINAPIDPLTKLYYPDLVCVWELKSKDAIRYTFKKFNLEERETEYTGLCFDYVEIIDGPHLSDRVMFGPQCGELDAFVIKGSNKQNFFIFVTDPFEEYEGFQVEYAPYTSNCGGDLLANDQLQTLKWDYDGSNSFCQWNIKTDSHHFVHIQLWYKFSEASR